MSDETGVVASIDEDGVLTLVAADGRNIELLYSNGAVGGIMGNFAPADAADSAALRTTTTAQVTLQRNRALRVDVWLAQ